MSFQAVVQTSPRSPPTLRTTLFSLALAGWPSPSISSEPGNDCLPSGYSSDVMLKQAGPWEHFVKILRREILRDWKYLLVSQDDVRYAFGLRRWLASQKLPDGIVSLYCCAGSTPGNDGWWKLSDDDLPRKAMGALAYVFSRTLAERFVKSVPKPGHAKIDLRVGRWCKENRIDYWQPNPSLCQHLGHCSAIEPGAQWLDQFRYAGDNWIRDMRGQASW